MSSKKKNQTLSAESYQHNKDDRIRFDKHTGNLDAWGKKDECCLWKISKDKDGYGRFALNGKTIKAHRFAYYIFNNKVPRQCLHVEHSRCGNKSCVNPLHLYDGTHRDNMDDLVRDGSLKGEKNPFFGKKHTEETRKKLSEMKKGEKNPLYGKKQSKETIEKKSKKLSKTWKLTSTEGTEHIINSLQQFCKEHNLNCGSVRSAASRGNQYKKKWTITQVNK